MMIEKNHVTKDGNPLRSFFVPWPSLLGWIASLVCLDQVTVSQSFLMSQTSIGFWPSLSLRMAFVFGTAFCVILVRVLPRWFGKATSVISLLLVSLSFCPLPQEALYCFCFLFACFSGMSCANFGLDFFLHFDNRQKFWTLIIAFPLVIPCLLFPTSTIFSFVTLALPSFFLIFRKNLPAILQPSLHEDAPEWWLLALAFFAFLLNGTIDLALMPGLLSYRPAVIPFSVCGIIAGSVAGWLFWKSRHLSMVYAICCSFLATALAGLCFFFFDNQVSIIIAGFFLGLSHSLGLLSLYYVLGVYTKKYQNSRFYYVGVFLSALGYSLSLFLVTAFPLDPTTNGRLWAVALVTIPLLLLCSALFFLHDRFDDEWVDDLKRSEVTLTDSLTAFFEESGLTKREKEVARLLLEGMTLRQIGAELGLSYPTINTYQNSIYHKLMISSRVELLLLCHPYSREKTKPH